MAIEIRELVIRATVDEAQGRQQQQQDTNNDARQEDKCDEDIEILIQMLKDKKER